MKKALFFMAILSIIAIACSSPDENQSTDELSVVNDRTLSPMSALLQKDDFQESLRNRLASRTSKGGNGNGVFVIQNNELYVPCGSDENYFVCAYAIEDGFYVSTIDVKFFPDGTAEFFANKKNVIVELYTLPDFELIYSNLCMDDLQNSSLHVNLKGNYELIYDPFYDIEYYDFIFEEVMSANNMQIKATVNNATTNLDIDLLTFDCIEPTTEKKIKATSLFKQNGGQNFKIHGL